MPRSREPSRPRRQWGPPRLQRCSWPVRALLRRSATPDSSTIASGPASGAAACRGILAHHSSSRALRHPVPSRSCGPPAEHPGLIVSGESQEIRQNALICAQRGAHALHMPGDANCQIIGARHPPMATSCSRCVIDPDLALSAQSRRSVSIRARCRSRCWPRRSAVLSSPRAALSGAAGRAERRQYAPRLGQGSITEREVTSPDPPSRSIADL
jgi:hypothetical protein